MKRQIFFVLAILAIVVFAVCGERSGEISVQYMTDAGEDILSPDFLSDTYEPVYFSERLVRTKRDLVFVKVKDRTTGDLKNLFAIGYD